MNKLQELRKIAKISQSNFAKAIKYSQSTISDWENGKIEPTMSALIAIANYFEVSIDYLAGRENDFGVIEINSNLSQKENELIGYFRKLKAFEQGQLLGIAKTLTQGI